MNEAETRAEHIDPMLAAAGWGVATGSRVRREFPVTAGRILAGGKREKALKADYVLEYRGRRLAVIEAKAWDVYYTEGVGQAKQYADRLGLRFAYATNGQKVYGIDMRGGQEGDISTFPGPDELWRLCFPQAEPEREILDALPFKEKGGGWSLRYYQHLAATRALDAIAAGRRRVLLTLATGTGKTAIAFQIAWKLFQARWNPQGGGQRRPRILFLADRNILANQAFNDFSSFMAFPDEALVRIRPEEIRKKGYAPKNGSVFFTIFQTFMSGVDALGNPAPWFGAYQPDFFDCVIIDECHRGGARDESTWRAILNHFAPALHIGLTATPKRDDNIDTYAYFGDPVYVYSLKEGINDGFLTPFKVRAIASTIDEYTYTPDDEVLEGEVERGQSFAETDFNVRVEIREREAFRVRQFLEEMRPMDKSLVFCASQRHALLVRDLINQYKTVINPNYCVRVAADDGALGEQYLRDFQDNEKSIPVILTTSHKLSTGVDARNIRNIVLLRPIHNMVEFKQIIGRGTRLFEGKDFFTIYDFVKASALFRDPEWDGEPIEPEPKPYPKPDPPPSPVTGEPDPEPPVEPRQLIRIRLADGKERRIQSIKATTFWGPDGRPVSAHEFLASLFGRLPDFFRDEDELRAIWSRPDTRKKLLAGLAEKGFDLPSLQEVQRAIDAENSDLYDVLAYIAFAAPMERRATRARQAQAHYPAACSDPQRAFLDFVLAQYVSVGFTELDDEKLPPLIKVRYGDSIDDALAELGNAEGVRRLFVDVQQWLYL